MSSVTLFALRRISTGRLLVVERYAEGSGCQSGVSTRLEEMDFLSTGSLWYSEDMQLAHRVALMDGKPHWTVESHQNPTHSFAGDIEVVVLGLIAHNLISSQTEKV